MNDNTAALWLIRALVALAKKELAERNLTCGKEWPAGQAWNELGATSQHAFMRAARERAGIPHDQYRQLVEQILAGPDAEAFDALWCELDTP